MSADVDGWLTPLRTRAALRAEELLSAHVEAAPLRNLLIRGLWGTCVSTEHRLGCIDLPILIGAAIRGEPGDAHIELAAICLLLYVGIDALDDLMDGDPLTQWPASEAEVLLGACTLTGLVVPGALEALEKDVKAHAMVETFERFSYRMAAGQLEDVRARGPVAPTNAHRIACCKSGEFTAGIAEMATRLANATEQQAELYVEMARELGTAQQVFSDYMDLLEPPGRDAVRGVWTLPIALYFESLGHEEQAQFAARHQRDRGDEDVAVSMDVTVLDDERLREGAILLELHCAHGLALLNEAGPSEPAGEGLRRMLRGNSPMTILELDEEGAKDGSQP